MFFEKVEISIQKLEIGDPKLTTKGKFSRNHVERDAPVERVPTVREHYRQIFYLAIDTVVSCIRDRFQQEDCIETLQTMEILILVISFSKYPSFFAVNWIIQIGDPTEMFDTYR